MEGKDKNITNLPIPVSIKGTETILEQMKNYVCKIHKTDGTKGTGFFCKIPYPDKDNLLTVLITNNHILSSEDLKKEKTILISMNDEKTFKSIKLDKFRIAISLKKYDITFIEINQKDEIKYFLEIDNKIIENQNNNIYNDIYYQKSIYILNYSEEKNIEASYGLLKEINGNLINHFSNTKEGSSGSPPILLLDNFKLIGVHCGSSKSFKCNKGVLLRIL